MSILQYARHGALALTLAAGLYATAGANDAVAGEAPPPEGPNGLIYSEQGFDFSLFDLTDGSQPFEISGTGGVFGFFPGSDGMLGFCTGCNDSSPNILSITRSDGALFSMTGFIGGSFPDFGEGGPVPTGLPGVDFVVAPDPFTTPFSAGLLIPALDFYAVETPLVSELLIFSPAPFDNFLGEDSDCLCFDSISFDVNFESIQQDFGPQTAQIPGTTPITVTFSAPVPEPTAMPLLGIGLAGLALARRRRRMVS